MPILDIMSIGSLINGVANVADPETQMLNMLYYGSEIALFVAVILTIMWALSGMTNQFLLTLAIICGIGSGIAYYGQRAARQYTVAGQLSMAADALDGTFGQSPYVTAQPAPPAPPQQYQQPQQPAQYGYMPSQQPAQYGYMQAPPLQQPAQYGQPAQPAQPSYFQAPQYYGRGVTGGADWRQALQSMKQQAVNHPGLQNLTQQIANAQTPDAFRALTNQASALAQQAANQTLGQIVSTGQSLAAGVNKLSQAGADLQQLGPLLQDMGTQIEQVKADLNNATQAAQDLQVVSQMQQTAAAITAEAAGIIQPIAAVGSTGQAASNYMTGILGR